MVTDESSRGYLWIAIASYDARFFRICQNYITCIDQSAFRCDVYQSGEELLAALRNGFPYRAVLLDNAMNDMDAPAFCSRLRDLAPKCRPWLLLVPTCSVDELCSLVRAGREDPPDEIRVRQMELSGLNSLLYDLESMLRAQAQTSSDDALIQLLLHWGEHPGSLGAQYLRECMELAVRCEPHFAIRKDVLMPVGERHSVSVTAVDSGIRRLIDKLNTLNQPAWQAFKQRRWPQKHRLTTGKFIYLLRDELLLPSQEPALTSLSEGEPHVDEREVQLV